MDITHRKVSNAWILFGLISAALISLCSGRESLCIAGFLASLPLLLLYALRVLGGADVKLLMVAGCFLGAAPLQRIGVLALFFALFLGVFLMITGGVEKRGRLHKIPAAPAIFLGVMCYRLYF